MFGQLLFQGLLILLNAIFACAEIAVISMNDNKLAKLAAAGDKRAVRLARLTSSPARFLATIQIGITLVNLLGSAFAAENFAGRLTGLFMSWGTAIPEGTLHAVSVVLITLILTYLTVTLGELVPKRIAMKNAEKLALGMSWLVYSLSRIFSPAVWLLSASANGILRLFGVDPTADEDENTEEEIRMMADAASEKGAIQSDEREMIQNIFEFDDLYASDLMTHRTEVAMLWLDESDDQWARTINESRFSLYPVCDDTADNIVGILNAKEYFRLTDRSREEVMGKAVQAAYFVPETVRADVLFRNMKNRRMHFAVVLDEYGGMSGIITINDLLECLVGDLEDDVSAPEEHPLVERLDVNTWCIRGTATLGEVALQLGVHLPEEDYDTFAGMVFGLLGSVPEDGSTPEIEEYGLAIKVTEITDHRLETALVCKAGTTEDAPAEKGGEAENGKKDKDREKDK